MSFTEILSREHTVVLEQLRAFEQAVQGRSADGLWKGLRFLEGGLTLHRRKEEDVLFPRLALHFPLGQGPVHCMLLEHRDEHEHISALRRALEQGRLDAAVEAGRYLLDLLRNHIWKEDNVLFPMAGHLLVAAEQEEVLKEFGEIGSCCPDCATARSEREPAR